MCFMVPLRSVHGSMDDLSTHCALSFFETVESEETRRRASLRNPSVRVNHHETRLSVNALRMKLSRIVEQDSLDALLYVLFAKL